MYPSSAFVQNHHVVNTYLPHQQKAHLFSTYMTAFPFCFGWLRLRNQMFEFVHLFLMNISEKQQKHQHKVLTLCLHFLTWTPALTQPRNISLFVSWHIWFSRPTTEHMKQNEHHLVTHRQSAGKHPSATTQKTCSSDFRENPNPNAERRHVVAWELRVAGGFRFGQCCVLLDFAIIWNSCKSHSWQCKKVSLLSINQTIDDF